MEAQVLAPANRLPVGFPAALAGRGEVAADTVAVVVAHPDDETIGIGGQLPRLRGVTLIHVTDDAPRNLGDANARGFATAADYAAARRRELEAAMALAGVPAGALIGLGVPDQEASLALPSIARRLADVMAERGIRIVLTHAYEGGHPDHDAVAFAVHAARGLLAREGGGCPALMEMPFYHAGPAGWVAQRFVPDPGRPELALALDETALRLKRRMLDAHATQGATLAAFGLERERFRPPPPYEFAELPNGGDLLYEGYDWGMTGARWQALAGGALAELGLETGFDPDLDPQAVWAR